MKKITIIFLILHFGFFGILYSQSSNNDASLKPLPSNNSGTKGVDINLKVFLEGAFNGLNMSTELNPQSIPLNQPFNTEPWNYTGSESTSEMPNSDIVDWILLEFRDAPNANTASQSTTIATQAAFILKDGAIVAIDGISKPQLSETVDQDLFVIIYHRNHLPILSASAFAMEGGEYVYDFTTAEEKAYGTRMQKDLGGVFGMYGGDVNASEEINTTDRDIFWRNDAGKNGYYSSDMNMDKEVNNPDKNDIWEPNQGKKSQLPGSCGTHTSVSLQLPDNCTSGGSK